MIFTRRKFLKLGGAAAGTSVVAIAAASQVYQGSQPLALPGGTGSWRVRRSAPSLTPSIINQKNYGAVWASGGNNFRVTLDVDFSFKPTNESKVTSMDAQVYAQMGARIEKQTGGVGAWTSYYTIAVFKSGKCTGRFRVETPDNNNEIAYLENVVVSTGSNGSNNPINVGGYTFTLSTSSTAASFTGSRDLDLKVKLTKPADGAQPATDVELVQALTVLLTE